MKVRFLLDENISPRVKTALLRLNPTIDVLRVSHLTRRSPQSPPIDSVQEQHQGRQETMHHNVLPISFKRYRKDPPHK